MRAAFPTAEVTDYESLIDAPFALVPLVWFSARRDLLGSWALSRRLTVVAVAATAVVIALNLALIVLSV